MIGRLALWVGLLAALAAAGLAMRVLRRSSSAAAAVSGRPSADPGSGIRPRPSPDAPGLGEAPSARGEAPSHDPGSGARPRPSPEAPDLGGEAPSAKAEAPSGARGLTPGLSADATALGGQGPSEALPAALPHRLAEALSAGGGAVSALAAAVVAVVLATGELGRALVGNDFAVTYVADFSRRGASAPYRLAALWGGMAGSLLFFAAVAGVVGLLAAWRLRGRPAQPVVVAVTGTLLAALIGLVLGLADPFERLALPPLDGGGLPPILEHPAMLYHPPLLYLGLATLAAPFALTVAGLLDRPVGVAPVRLGPDGFGASGLVHSSTVHHPDGPSLLGRPGQPAPADAPDSGEGGGLDHASPVHHPDGPSLLGRPGQPAPADAPDSGEGGGLDHASPAHAPDGHGGGDGRLVHASLLGGPEGGGGFGWEAAAMVRRWLMVPWTLLAVGMVAGAHWAYVELGWGGYWAWDPVENTALLPWLGITLALHAGIREGGRSSGRAQAAFVCVAFLLALTGTMLTRSGAVPSVHAFAEDEAIGRALAALVAGAVVAVLVLFVRTRRPAGAPAEPALPTGRTIGEALGAVPVRGLLAAQMAIVGAALAITFVGTVAPLYSDLTGGDGIAIEGRYFASFAGPLAGVGLALLALVPIALRLRAGAAVALDDLVPLGVGIILGGGVLTAADGDVRLPQLVLACVAGAALASALVGGYDAVRRPRPTPPAGIDPAAHPLPAPDGPPIAFGPLGAPAALGADAATKVEATGPAARLLPAPDAPPIALDPLGAPTALDPTGTADIPATTGAPTALDPMGTASSRPTAGAPTALDPTGTADSRPTAGAPTALDPTGTADIPATAGAPTALGPMGTAGSRPTTGAPTALDPTGTANSRPTTGAPTPLDPTGTADIPATAGAPTALDPMGTAGSRPTAGAGRARRGRMGPHLAHAGVGLLLLGVAGTATGRTVSTSLAPGETVEVLGEQVRYVGVWVDDGQDDGTSAVVADVEHAGRKLQPALVAYPNLRRVLPETSLVSSPWRDVQVALVDAADDGTVVLRVGVHPLQVWVWWGGLTIVAAGVLTAWEHRRWARRPSPESSVVAPASPSRP